MPDFLSLYFVKQKMLFIYETRKNLCLFEISLFVLSCKKAQSMVFRYIKTC